MQTFQLEKLHTAAICLPIQILLHDFPLQLNQHSELLPRRQTGLQYVSGTYPWGAGKGTALRCQQFLWDDKAEEEILPLTSRTLFLTLFHLYSVCHKTTIHNIVMNQKITAVGIVTILSFCKVRVKCIHPSKHLNLLCYQKQAGNIQSIKHNSAFLED